jgi:hypothetical protein
LKATVHLLRHIGYRLIGRMRRRLWEPPTPLTPDVSIIYTKKNNLPVAIWPLGERSTADASVFLYLHRTTTACSLSLNCIPFLGRGVQGPSLCSSPFIAWLTQALTALSVCVRIRDQTSGHSSYDILFLSKEFGSCRIGPFGVIIKLDKPSRDIPDTILRFA